MIFTKKELPNLIKDFLVKEKITLQQFSEQISIEKDKLLSIVFENAEISDEDFKKISLFLTIGSENYQKIKDKDITAGMIVANSTLSVTSILTVLYSLGITGLSASGITTALAVLGGLIGGGMVSGILVLSAIPLVIYGLTKQIFK